MPYANDKGADQPARMLSLTSACIARCLDSLIPVVGINPKHSRLCPATDVEQAGVMSHT